MASDAIETKIRSWANQVVYDHGMRLPITQEEAELAALRELEVRVREWADSDEVPALLPQRLERSIIDALADLDALRGVAQCSDCGAVGEHSCEGVPGGFGDESTEEP